SFFSADRPPPSPPLSPYTTLFRSQQHAGHHGESQQHRAGPSHVALPRALPFGSVHLRRPPRSLSCASPDYRVAYHVTDGPLGEGDRKSTRLNSSHVKISYAVFCLK